MEKIYQRYVLFLGVRLQSATLFRTIKIWVSMLKQGSTGCQDEHSIDRSINLSSQ